jgi:hypothetical protein
MVALNPTKFRAKHGIFCTIRYLSYWYRLMQMAQILMDLEPQMVFPIFAHHSDHFSNTPTGRIRNPGAAGRRQATAQEPRMITLRLLPLTETVELFNVHESDPISRVFDRAANVAGTPRNDIRLIIAGHQLAQNDSTVHEVGLTHLSTIHVVAPSQESRHSHHPIRNAVSCEGSI